LMGRLVLVVGAAKVGEGEMRSDDK